MCGLLKPDSIPKIRIRTIPLDLFVLAIAQLLFLSLVFKYILFIIKDYKYVYFLPVSDKFRVSYLTDNLFIFHINYIRSSVI